MKKIIRKMAALLTVLAVTFAFVFTACSDEKEEGVESYSYSYGFTETSASHPDFLDEMKKIEGAYRSALGPKSTFTLNGSLKECDEKVSNASFKAFASLNNEKWQGNYKFEVKNVTTGKMICNVKFSTDNDNLLYGPWDEANEWMWYCFNCEYSQHGDFFNFECPECGGTHISGTSPSGNTVEFY